MKRLLISVLAAAAMVSVLPLRASAADAEDVFRAMADVGCTEGMITDARTQYESMPYDDQGMQMGVEYHTFDEWVVLIHEGGVTYVLSVIAKNFGVEPQDLIDYYELNTPAATVPDQNGQQGENGTTVTTVTTVFEPSVQPERPFAEMTMDEMRAYIDSLPYEERVAFIANLTAEQRRSILRQFTPDQKADVAAGMVDFGRTIGLNVTVDSADKDGVQLSVRDADGKLIDATSLGLSVDPTGWDTTLPVFCGAGMMLTACGGLYLISRKQKEEHHG